MKLPNVENAEISEAKIARYLLSTTHRDRQKQSLFLYAVWV
jgi:hypothetical protein